MTTGNSASSGTDDSKANPMISTGRFARPGRVLLVEDDHYYRTFLKRVLEEDAHLVLVATSGKEALELAEKEQPNLVLLDLGLPDMDGREVCKILKGRPSGQYIPVIVITAQYEDEVQAEVLEAGANDFVSKMADARVLTARVRAMLKYQRALEALRDSQRNLTRRVERQAVDLTTVNRELRRRVTDLERLEEEARRSSERLDQLLGTIPSILICLDADNRVTHWNEVSTNCFGLQDQDVLGRPLVECGISWDTSAVLEAILECQESQARVRIDRLPFKRSTKEEGLLGLNISPMPDVRQGVSGVLIFGADITHRVSLEEQFLQAQKMDAIGRLAGGVAHDFNNMLTVITGQCELLLRRTYEREQQVSRIGEILSCANKAGTLTSQLLAFSRQQVQNREVMNLNRIVEDNSQMLSRMIGEHISMRFVPDRDIGNVYVDAGQMAQVLMNLAVNARDAMPSGGQLEIRTEKVPPGSARSKLPIEHVMLAVSDTGKGIDAATQARIFEPFFTTKTKGKGTGLGLATVYGIVEQSDGVLSVESKVGEGATFRAYFPAVKDSAQSKPAHIEQSEPAVGTETILLVEDEPSVREMVNELLSASGYHVIEAASPAEAIEKYKDPQLVHIDLLLTDLVMPVMNGIELCGVMRNARPGLKWLYMSGHSQDLLAEMPGKPKHTQVIQKPFASADLLRRVREALEEQPTGSPASLN